VKELVEHKRFPEQCKKFTEKDDHQAAEVETSDAPVVDSTSDRDAVVDAPDAETNTSADV
jgi:hypothetical protein